MKSSLEDERRALLEQIEASRAVYRRMLTGEPITGRTQSARHAGGLSTEMPAEQSRHNRAMQWIFEHPLQVAAAVALLVLLAPRIAGRTRGLRHREVRRQERALASGGTLRALLTVAAMLLRDPVRLRTVTTVARNAWRWLSHRRPAPVMFTRTTTATSAVTPAATSVVPPPPGGTRLH